MSYKDVLLQCFPELRLPAPLPACRVNASFAPRRNFTAVKTARSRASPPSSPSARSSLTPVKVEEVSLPSFTSGHTPTDSTCAGEGAHHPALPRAPAAQPRLHSHCQPYSLRDDFHILEAGLCAPREHWRVPAASRQLLLSQLAVRLGRTFESAYARVRVLKRLVAEDVVLVYFYRFEFAELRSSRRLSISLGLPAQVKPITVSERLTAEEERALGELRAQIDSPCRAALLDRFRAISPAQRLAYPFLTAAVLAWLKPLAPDEQPGLNSLV